MAINPTLWSFYLQLHLVLLSLDIQHVVLYDNKNFFIYAASLPLNRDNIMIIEVLKLFETSERDI
jgi:hypothetical protein